MKKGIIQEGIVSYKVQKKRSPLPFLAAGFVFLLVGLFSAMVHALDYLFAALVSCGMFFMSRLVFKDQEVRIELPPDTGDAQTDQLIAEARTMLSSFHVLEEQIEDKTVSGHIIRIEKKCAQILSRLKEQPALLSQLRTFLRYYLPTTHKLLEARAAIEKSGMSSENARLVCERTDRVLPEIERAFGKQLEALDKHRYMDIQVEMDVLEGMLKADGLSE
jgi:hypothetical protein